MHKRALLCVFSVSCLAILGFGAGPACSSSDEPAKPTCMSDASVCGQHVAIAEVQQFCMDYLQYDNNELACINEADTGTYERGILEFCADHMPDSQSTITNDADIQECLRQAKNRSFPQDVLRYCGSTFGHSGTQLHCLDLLVTHQIRQENREFCAGLDSQYNDQRMECLEHFAAGGNPAAEPQGE